MTAADIKALAAAIGRELRKHRSALSRETQIHDCVAAALTELGIAFEREHRLSLSSRLDFFLPATRTAIEVKKGNVGLSFVAQVGRYLESDEVADCILIAMRIDSAVPKTFLGKPIAHVALWKFLL